MPTSARARADRRAALHPHDERGNDHGDVCDNLRVLTARDHPVGTPAMQVIVDKVAKATWDYKGDGILANLTYGPIMAIMGLANGSYVIKLKGGGALWPAARACWGGAKASWMGDANPPNHARHADLSQFVHEAVKLP
jgi:hypothetical protein